MTTNDVYVTRDDNYSLKYFDFTEIKVVLPIKYFHGQFWFAIIMIFMKITFYPIYRMQIKHIIFSWFQVYIWPD